MCLDVKKMSQEVHICVREVSKKVNVCVCVCEWEEVELLGVYYLFKGKQVTFFYLCKEV